MTDRPWWHPRSWPAHAWRAVVFEVDLYRSLARWLRRRPDIPAGARPRGYAQQVTPVMWLWIFASAAELPLVHVLVPWEAVRIALLAVGVWGLVWMLGLLASLHVFPHLLTDEAVRVRNGKRHDVRVPWEWISSVRHDDRGLESSVWALQPRETERGTELQVGVSGRVNVELRLDRVRTVGTAKGPMDVSAVSFWCDDPRAVVRELKERAGARR